MKNSIKSSDRKKFAEKSSSQETVLIIDDSLDTLDLQELILDSQGYKVMKAQSGGEALQLLKQKSQSPDLILLDFCLEDMTGLTFLKTLERLRPEIISEVPVVFVTGMNEVPPSRAVGVIKKPSELEDFKEAVGHFLLLRNKFPVTH
jgi:CheY-like chemotaxis protein